MNGQMPPGQKAKAVYLRQQDPGDQILIGWQMPLINLQGNSSERATVHKLISSHAICETYWLKIKCE